MYFSFNHIYMTYMTTKTRNLKCFKDSMKHKRGHCRMNKSDHLYHCSHPIVTLEIVTPSGDTG